MGKGDRKTRRGKTYRGSYGNTRAHAAVPAVVGTKSTVSRPARPCSIAGGTARRCSIARSRTQASS